MFESILIHILVFMYHIAPFGFAFNLVVLVWLLIMSRKWKLDDPANWHQK